MTTTKDITAKFAVAAVAVAMIFSAYATPAAAQTDLQAQITALLAQIQMLEAQLTGGADVTSPVGAPALCPYTWTRDLTMGSEGADVMKLQQFLNSYPDLRVAATGAGSVGMETMFFGPATAAAVSKMQVMFRAEVLTPNGLVNATGYFGPSSRAKANDLCIADATTGEVDDAEEGTEEEEEEADMTLSGEGTISTFEIDDEEDEVAEGAEDVVVASLKIEAENGDVELARVTMTLVDASLAGDANEENDPWDVFEEVSLWIDGDKVASFEADDEDNYLDEDAGEFRFSNLALFLGEDEEVEVLVAVSVQNSVDGSDAVNADLRDWTIDPTEIRFFDADGVAVTDSTVDELDNAGETFVIIEEGADDQAEIESASNNPDATTLKVDTDGDDSDEFLVHVFEIEVDEDSSDLTVEDTFINVLMASAVAVVGGQEDVIDEITMTIDGTTVTGEATTVNDAENLAIDVASGNDTDVRYRFEFDGDLELEADETYEVEVMITFKGQDGNYGNGVTIVTTATGAQWEVEGSASDNELEGDDSSEEHTLSDSVPVISGVSSDVDRNEAGDAGVISFEFNIEAEDEDVVLNFFNVDGDINGGTDDIRFSVTPGGGVFTTSLVEIDGDVTIDVVNNTITINDGDNATFALDVTFTDAGAAGNYRVNLESIGGVEVDEISNGLSI